jgi:NADH dehydrogenase [ubiquinone] 1 alpha subcomplex assembly factor 7
MTDDAPLYDPNARRDTPLARLLKDRIRATGPITVATYMSECLTHPEYGYYSTRQTIGRAGDFITAPEISQIFGELIGLWCAVVWQQMGSPEHFTLAEIGPGRGTMISDMIRATRKVPGFLSNASIHLVDVADTAQLANNLKSLVPETPVVTHSRTMDLPSNRPMILVANEYLDTLAVQQFVVADSACYIRGVGLDSNDQLHFVLMQRAMGDDVDFFTTNAHLKDGDIIEAQDLTALHRMCFNHTAPWAALMIDYGQFNPARHQDNVVASETLQALRNHTHEHPLTSPGEADLTVQVDFDDIALNVSTALVATDRAPLIVDGPIMQSDFLVTLGIVERARALMAANPARINEIETAVARLIAIPGMGNRFKAIGWRSPRLPPLPGFD